MKSIGYKIYPLAAQPLISRSYLRGLSALLNEEESPQNRKKTNEFTVELNG
jgi:hypothetical protein